MIRAPMGDQNYWNGRINILKNAIKEKKILFETRRNNKVYEAQFNFGLAQHCHRLMLLTYSQGGLIKDMRDYFPEVLEHWELSNQLSTEICAENNLTTCRDWDFSLSNLNHYNWCFWLVGLALALDIPDDLWQRLLALIGGEGEDILLDRVIASRQPDRKIGLQLLHPKPYTRLLKAIDAPKEQQAALLLDFVDHWYLELKRPAPKNRRAPTIEPFWYIYGDPEKHPLSMGSYFGRWCIEAVAAVKAFGLDDSLCLGHDHYPGDLLRPDGSSTHRPRPEEPEKNLSFWRRLLGK